MTPAELIARARSVIGRGVKYKLSRGGINPKAEHPANADHECDCSGAVCWMIGLSRMTRHPLYLRYANVRSDYEHAWINTDSMYYDGYERQAGFFELLPQAKAGALIVYPGEARRKLIGHVGIVSAEAKGNATKVIHCSSGNFRRYGDAIQETDAAVFHAQPKTIHIWFCGLEG